MSYDTVKDRIQPKLPMISSLKARIALDFGEEGRICIDATKTPPEFEEAGAGADLTLTCALKVFEAILDGTQDPTMAYMMGKLKVKGPMGLAMKLNSILED